MLPAVENESCFAYLKRCTSIYPDVWMMQHFGVRYRKSKMFHDIDALSAYFQNELGLRLLQVVKYMFMHMGRCAFCMGRLDVCEQCRGRIGLDSPLGLARKKSECVRLCARCERK